MKMALCPQMANPHYPKSNFKRTASKLFVQEANMYKYHADVEMWPNFKREQLHRERS
jgi:hypothetical protein